MRLKKVPKGTKIIRLQNNSKKEDCMIYWNKKPFIILRAGCFKIIESRYFFVGRPLESFPEMQLYANKRIEVIFG